MAGLGDDARRLTAPGEDAGADFVREAMRADPGRLAVLATVRDLGLADGWVAAGFVRAAVWDALHGFEASTPVEDIDVIYFDPHRATPAADRAAEAALARAMPDRPWSVRNQARMHARNGDHPYRSSADAMMHWLETPTAVGVALAGDGSIEVLAPFGLGDLLGMVIRPTPHARSSRMAAFRQRLEAKPWLKQWPRSRLAGVSCCELAS